MDFEFDNNDIKRLSEDASYSGGYPASVVKQYRKRIQIIDAAKDERDFYALKSLHFEKLKGKRKAEYSMRLNDQWRLILKFRKDESNKIVIILNIEDYH